MGRGKIEIKKIENVNSRQVTFSKRRAGLLKKAHELSVLCDSEVAVIIFSNTGKLFQFSSSSMNQTLARYNKCIESSENSIVEHEEEKKIVNELDVMKEEVAKLKLKQQRLMARDLSGFGLQELQQLEQLLNEGLLSVKDRKEQILKEQLEQSRVQEQKVMLENATLRKQIEELRGVFPPNTHPVSGFLEYSHPKMNNSPFKLCASNSDIVCTENGQSSLTDLHLGLTPSHGHRKRKVRDEETPEKETHSGTSESQIDM